MIKFSLYRVNSCKIRSCLILIGSMQFIGALMTEVINILLIQNEGDIQNIVMNFVQFAVIAQIDDFYAMSIKNSFLRSLVKRAYLNFSSIEGKGFQKIPLNKDNCCSGCLLLCLYKPLQLFYNSIYYYFFPFSVVIYTFIMQI